jgi:hypothetical protein
MSFNPYSCTKHPRARRQTRNGITPGGWVDLAVRRGAPPLFYVQCPCCGRLTCSRHVNGLISDGWLIEASTVVNEGIVLPATCPHCRKDLPSPAIYRCKCCQEQRISYSAEALKRMGWTIIGDLVYCPEHTKSHRVSLAALTAKVTEAQIEVKL